MAKRRNTRNKNAEQRAPNKKTCRYCVDSKTNFNIRFESFTELRAHNEKMHPGILEFCPLDCSHVYGDDQALYRHVYRDHYAEKTIREFREQCWGDVRRRAKALKRELIEKAKRELETDSAGPSTSQQQIPPTAQRHQDEQPRDHPESDRQDDPVNVESDIRASAEERVAQVVSKKEEPGCSSDSQHQHYGAGEKTSDEQHEQDPEDDQKRSSSSPETKRPRN